MPLRAAPAASRLFTARRRAAHVAISVARRRGVFVSGLLQISSWGGSLPPGGSSAVLTSIRFNGLFARWETSFLQNCPLQIRLVLSTTGPFRVRTRGLGAISDRLLRISNSLCGLLGLPAAREGHTGPWFLDRCGCVHGPWGEGSGGMGGRARGRCQGAGKWGVVCGGGPPSCALRTGFDRLRANGEGSERACDVGWWGRAAARRTSGYRLSPVRRWRVWEVGEAETPPRRHPCPGFPLSRERRWGECGTRGGWW